MILIIERSKWKSQLQKLKLILPFLAIEFDIFSSHLVLLLPVNLIKVKLQSIYLLDELRLPFAKSVLFDNPTFIVSLLSRSFTTRVDFFAKEIESSHAWKSES